MENIIKTYKEFCLNESLFSGGPKYQKEFKKIQRKYINDIQKSCWYNDEEDILPEFTIEDDKKIIIEILTRNNIKYFDVSDIEYIITYDSWGAFRNVSIVKLNDGNFKIRSSESITKKQDIWIKINFKTLEDAWVSLIKSCK